MIDAGDMEQLALLVLNGEGKSLLGKSSTQPDIQAFIDNIPTYTVSCFVLGIVIIYILSFNKLSLIIQSKIRKVHVAAREGSLRDLQASLDRRKFSTAKDEISPKGKEDDVTSLNNLS